MSGRDFENTVLAALVNGGGEDGWMGAYEITQAVPTAPSRNDLYAALMVLVGRGSAEHEETRNGSRWRAGPDIGPEDYGYSDGPGPDGREQ